MAIGKAVASYLNFLVAIFVRKELLHKKARPYLYPLGIGHAQTRIKMHVCFFTVNSVFSIMRRNGKKAAHSGMGHDPRNSPF